MNQPKLRQRRQVLPPTCIARNDEHGQPGATIAIPILGLDPRVVLAVSVWVERWTDVYGPDNEWAAVASGVSWSIYSAAYGADKKLRAMTALAGFDRRVIRPANAWGPDRILRSGDAAEISACGDLLLSVRHEDTSGSVWWNLGQTVWFAVDVYPSDALAESAQEEAREAYRGLLEQVRVAAPSPVPILAIAGG